MKERILNLFNLCMEAKEKGHHITFMHSYYDLDIWQMVQNPDTQEFDTVWSIHVILSEANDTVIDEAEAYLKGLIA